MSTSVIKCRHLYMKRLKKMWTRWLGEAGWEAYLVIPALLLALGALVQGNDVERRYERDLQALQYAQPQDSRIALR